VDLAALVGNCAALRQWARPATQFMAVVKADAYGHGALTVASALAGANPDIWLGVVTASEAEEVRAAAPHSRVCVLAPLDHQDLAVLVRCGATPVLSDAGSARAAAIAAREAESPFRVHIEVDTGMGRGGALPDELPGIVAAILGEPKLHLEGLMTHFPDAERDPAFTLGQVRALVAARQAAVAAGARPPILHAANSAGLIRYEAARLDLVRPGMALYGLLPALPVGTPTPVLKPVLSLRARVLLLRDLPKGRAIGYGRTRTLSRPTRIALLGIGYADGYPRALSDRGVALIRGSRAPVLGRVCMDLTTVDVTDIRDVALGDVATLIGRDGHEEVRADELARDIGATEHEITTCLGARVRRWVTPVC
jgi:alanine racemase